ncbi:MAG: ribonuclease HII [Paludibacteraceae bacterium]|jgi:ribonuclease HII|nr:ribonuclease HII [Paludibacteraceae bacterium]
MLQSYLKADCVEVGVDEAGRGCLAGDVYAAAVVLPDGFSNELLNDSKQLTEKQREQLREVIEREAVAWAVGVVTAKEIDEINILNASILAMHRALAQVEQKLQFRHIIVDGNRFKPYKDVAYQTVVKGDGKYMSIAAASVLAKTHRDEYMCRLHEEYPQYDWKGNKGYPTKKHRLAIEQYGTTPYHRMTFRLLDTQQTLNFDYE